ncbi:hypothetical protein JQS43_01450 [Natronosporangium hydrolyticum]|uniref:Uncharacterized protein n=1 Tax=Natronosporangium hydrolyticum TaxID=2811111 RepID=A0A895YG71_9ACTN|nr:hypothetical protein [Natronosporangium hydrolyticum]QSB15075.1 hypothetical protein JQS43_01450 [Natronosporangium hydrolyticum]
MSAPSATVAGEPPGSFKHIKESGFITGVFGIDLTLEPFITVFQVCSTPQKAPVATLRPATIDEPITIPLELVYPGADQILQQLALLDHGASKKFGGFKQGEFFVYIGTLTNGGPPPDEVVPLQQENEGLLLILEGSCATGSLFIPFAEPPPPVL